MDHIIWSLSRVGYAYKNFDPLARHHIFSDHVFKMKFDPLLTFDAVIGMKVDQTSF